MEKRNIEMNASETEGQDMEVNVSETEGQGMEVNASEMEENKDELTMSEREELEQLRKERDERNLKEKAYDKIYDNLHLSVRGLDIFIAIMIILFFFVVIKGMMV